MMSYAKKILIIGDSNTWGFDAKEFDRTGSIQRLPLTWVDFLEGKINVESENITVSALNGRTINYDDTEWSGRNFSTQLSNLLEENYGVHKIIIFLGLNDFKEKYNLSVDDVIISYRNLINNILDTYSNEKPEILIISPPMIKHELAYEKEFLGASEKIECFNEKLEVLAEEKSCKFLNSNEIAFTMADDGIHFIEADHENFSNLVSSALFPENMRH